MLNDQEIANIMTIVKLLGGNADPRFVRQEYSRALDQIAEFRRDPDESEFDPGSRS
jgi:hypothetical protein